MLSEYLIAYIDILGIQNKICSNDESTKQLTIIFLNNLWDETLNTIKSIQPLATGFEKIIFSDNIVIALKTENMDEQTIKTKSNELFLFVMCIQYLAFIKGFLVRGSISFGELYIDSNKNFVCGAGLVKTYKEESNLALYPRIISIDNNVLKLSDNITISSKTQIHNPFILAEDGIYYLDFMQVALITGSHNIIKRGKNIYEKELQRNPISDSKIIQKNQWFINYYNNFCERYTVTDAKIQDIIHQQPAKQNQ